MIVWSVVCSLDLCALDGPNLKLGPTNIGWRKRLPRTAAHRSEEPGPGGRGSAQGTAQGSGPATSDWNEEQCPTAHSHRNGERDKWRSRRLLSLLQLPGTFSKLYEDVLATTGLSCLDFRVPNLNLHISIFFSKI